MNVILFCQLTISCVGAVELIQEFNICCFGAEFTNTFSVELGQGAEATCFPSFVDLDLSRLHTGKNAVDGCGDHDLIVVPRGSQDEVTVMDIDVG